MTDDASALNNRHFLHQEQFGGETRAHPHHAVVRHPGYHRAVPVRCVCLPVGLHGASYRCTATSTVIIMA